MTLGWESKAAEWQRLTDVQKTLFNWPSWSEDDPYQESRKDAVAEGRLPLKSSAAARSHILVSMAEENVAIEGVRIRFMIWKTRPLEDMTATFEVFDRVRWLCISRVDFCPTAPHTNVHWRKCKLEPTVVGSHVHGCGENIRLGAEAFAPRGNLPNATALAKEPQSFKEASHMVGALFNLVGFENIDPPEWNWSLSL